MNNAAEYVMVYMTASNRTEALHLARVLIEERLAACVNVLGEVTSVYRWEGRIEESAEVALVAKTRAALFETLRRRVVALHSYELPCIVAYPMADAHAPYLAWITAQTPAP